MKKATLSTVLLASAASLLSINLNAQPVQEVNFPPASPSSTVKEKVGLTDVEIYYARPSAKGRKVFGGLVPHGQMWRTGANHATKLTFSTDVTFGGKAVPAGSYALFTIPGDKEWTMVLNTNHQQWGSYGYNKEEDVVRVTAKPKKLADPVETFTMGLSHMRTDSAHLTLAWENTSVSVPIKTDIVSVLVPQIEAAMVAEGENKPYFAAAMFYYEHDLDMTKAVDWIEAAAMLQPDAMWITYRKGLVLHKAGNKEGAMAAAKEALAMAEKAGGELGDEYMRLSKDLIAKLK